MSIGSKPVGRLGLAVAGGVVVLLLVAASKTPSVAPKASIGADHQLSAQVLIRSAGHRCDEINAMVRLATKQGFRVTCDGSRYAYELMDHGGNLVVRVD